MENQKVKKCSSKNHKDLEAINYCQECKINMCTKCSNFHSEIFGNHHIEKLSTETNEIFDGFCSEKNHNLELEFFCITHNQLCCAACLCKIKNKGKGQHNECQVCNIEEIKNKKKNELDKNINILEDFTKIIESTINELKEINEEINKNKESLMVEVQKIFTKIRCLLNEREDKLLSEIEKQYNELYFKEEMIKRSEKLPKKMNSSLEKGKIVNNEWDNDDKLNYIIFNCVNIENNIKEINEINDCIKKYKATNSRIKFFPEEEEFNRNLNIIKTFGEIRTINDLKLIDIEPMEKIDNNIKIYNEEIRPIKVIEEIRPIEEKSNKKCKKGKKMFEDDISKFVRVFKEQYGEYYYNNIETKLIYDARRDGDNYKFCHSKCNNIPNTFSIIITDNGAKFGFFRSIPIDGDGPWRVDNKAFFFSYDKNKIYKIRKEKYVIGFDNTFFVQTIGFGLSGNILNDKYSYNQKKLNENFEGFTEDYELTFGKEEFYVKRFEVYQLKY